MSNNLEQLLIDVKESLEREIREGFSDMRTRFDTQAARLERHGGVLQAGTRWSSRMDAGAEKVDSALEVKDREIAELRERLMRLEKRSA